MFSTNEQAEEIATDNLKYLLLPFFLGQLTSKIQKRDRLECLKVAEVYYRDFIKRCEDYEIVKRESEIAELNSTPRDEKAELVQMAIKRNTKIEKYRQKKELEEQLKMLKIAIERDNVDDEIKRDFYMKLIQSSIIETKDELDSIKMELQILEMRKSSGAEELENSDNFNGGPPSHSHDSSHNHRHHHHYRPEPLKPIIITRNEMQKAVYGMGYPSLPVMTVSEFYDQRVAEGIFPDPEKAAHMKPVTGEKTEEEVEQERAEQDELEDADDETYLARRRAFDEYKDNVRRGDGNRYNRS